MKGRALDRMSLGEISSSENPGSFSEGRRSPEDKRESSSRVIRGLR